MTWRGPELVPETMSGDVLVPFWAAAGTPFVAAGAAGEMLTIEFAGIGT